MQDATELSDAVKRLMPYAEAEERDEEMRGRPVRVSAGDRRIVVLDTPQGVEARSCCRVDLTVNLDLSAKRLIEGGGGTVVGQTDRMLEVRILEESVEIFIDGRMRCVAPQQDPNRVANLIREVAFKLVLA
jgi:hypothetical protein